jgi:anhydro-N-acetylmuramic acid kinase
MSGTSLDGVDAVVAHLVGSGRDMAVDVLGTARLPYPEALRSLILRNSSPSSSSVREITLLGPRLADLYVRAVKSACEDAGLTLDDLHLAGSHGQTLHHVPEGGDCAGASVRGTLQVDDPAALAQRLGVPVVGNFRTADVALGGHGAPLAPYLDDVLFADADETRLLLNLGGIANLTVLPAGGQTGDLMAFDTGPANMVIDALAQRLYDEPYDADGEHATAGTADADLLSDLLGDDYFQQAPPKSTGREHFGAAFADRLLNAARDRDLGPDDTLATATLLTAASVYQAYARHVRPHHPADVVFASGGGVHNAALMQMLENAFAPIPVRRTGDVDRGVDPDVKEALLFAVLAHETANGVPTGLPNVTGARRAAIQGALYQPAPEEG